MAEFVVTCRECGTEPELVATDPNGTYHFCPDCETFAHLYGLENAFAVHSVTPERSPSS